MENREKKRLLNSYRQLVKQEQVLKDALEYNRERYLAGSPKYDGMPHGHSQSDLSSYVAKAESLLDELQDVMTRKHETLRLILRSIEALPNETEKTVLMLRYIRGMTFEETAKEIGRSYRHVTRLHGSALAHFNPGVKG